MDETTLRQNIGKELIDGWNITATGNGFLVATDWHWPNQDRIEIFVRAVGEREDLFVVTDGGDLFNFLFSHGIDLARDGQAMKIFNSISRSNGAEFVDYQIIRGANPADLARAVRLVLEAIKDIAHLLWYKLGQEQEGEPV